MLCCLYTHTLHCALASVSASATHSLLYKYTASTIYRLYNIPLLLLLLLCEAASPRVFCLVLCLVFCLSSLLLG